MALRLENDSIARFDVLAETERAALVDLGMQETSFAPEEAAQLDTLWANGVWQIAEAGAPDAIARLRSLARAAGLSD